MAFDIFFAFCIQFAFARKCLLCIWVYILIHVYVFVSTYLCQWHRLWIPLAASNKSHRGEGPGRGCCLCARGAFGLTKSIVCAHNLSDISLADFSIWPQVKQKICLVNGPLAEWESKRVCVREREGNGVERYKGRHLYYTIKQCTPTHA